MKITENLRMEWVVPLQTVSYFYLDWKPNRHAHLELSGSIQKGWEAVCEQIYESKIKICLDTADGEQNIFWGYITVLKTESEGNFEKVYLEAKSASCMLDKRRESWSFQNVENTYAKTVKEAIQQSGGQVICTAGKENKMETPLIRYGETVWEFVMRLARYLGTCVIPDIITGRPNLWFGMRKGSHIPAFSENRFSCDVKKGEQTEISYQTESRNFYKIGDQTVFLGRNMRICSVEAIFKNGELIFTYRLKEQDIYERIEHNGFAGLELMGTVEAVYQDRLKVSLDIDRGISTDGYAYPYYPETGNSLYAMPEKGARVALHFCREGGREGYILHCLPNGIRHQTYSTDKYVDTVYGNSVHLFGDSIDFFQKNSCHLSLCNENILFSSSNKLYISAVDEVKIKARRITVSTPDELNVCQG